MTSWTSAELNAIGAAEELQLSSLRRDGTLRAPVTIWVVRQGDDLYVRAVRGRDGWFRGTQARHQGRIAAGGIEKDVTFVEEIDAHLNEQLDAAYRAKYRRYAANIIGSILTPAARDTTLKLLPRSSSPD
jgi:hypothetical protein